MTGTPGVGFSAWRFVTTFGVISLLADIVYEGARSITGPLLASLGATAVVVGVVTGVGEAAALILRVVSGPLADRTGRFWTWTDRRPDHQGAAAADHGQGHPGFGHHRPHP